MPALWNVKMKAVRCSETSIRRCQIVINHFKLSNFQSPPWESQTYFITIFFLPCRWDRWGLLSNHVLPIPAVNGGVLPENWRKETARDWFFMRQIEFVPAEVVSYMEPAERGSDRQFHLYLYRKSFCLSFTLQEYKFKLFPVSLRLEFYWSEKLISCLRHSVSESSSSLGSVGALCVSACFVFWHQRSCSSFA